MSSFRAYRVTKTADGVESAVVDRALADLPEGELLIDVAWSSVNYKDGLSAAGRPGVTRNYPHTPGIDAAGTVRESSSAEFAVGDEVIVIGYDLGMNTPGGFAECIRVPVAWAVRRPAELSLRESMILGTAGFTAALCIGKLQQQGASPTDGPVLVTGASGGVGCVAVSILAAAGYEVVAATGKPQESDWLTSLGAASVLDREQLAESDGRPLGKGAWAHAVDTVGGIPLANIIKQLEYGGSVAACGLVAGAALETTVLPFILRGVNLLGVDSVELPIAAKAATWQRLAGDWKPGTLDAMVTEIGLEGIDDVVGRILQGQVRGRTLVDPRR